MQIGRDTTIHPFTVIEGDTVIGEACEIGPHAQIRDSNIDDGVVIESAMVIDSHSAEEPRSSRIPILRPGAEVGAGLSRRAFETPKPLDEEGLSEAHGTM